MAFGVRPPALGEWIVNLGEAAEYMFDHNIFQDNLVGVDFCEQMIKETNPGVFAKARTTARPVQVAHDRRGHHHALDPFFALSLLGSLPIKRPITHEESSA